MVAALFHLLMFCNFTGCCLIRPYFPYVLWGFLRSVPLLVANPNFVFHTFQMPHDHNPLWRFPWTMTVWLHWNWCSYILIMSALLKLSYTTLYTHPLLTETAVYIAGTNSTFVEPFTKCTTLVKRKCCFWSALKPDLLLMCAIRNQISPTVQPEMQSSLKRWIKSRTYSCLN